MQDENNQTQKEPVDPNLDIPSEAARGKHINFLEVEEESSTNTGKKEDDFAAERQRQWKEGLEEGKQIRRENE